MIRITINLDVSLTAREATGRYDEALPEPSDKVALVAVREALRSRGPLRFLEAYGLDDSLDIELEIES